MRQVEIGDRFIEQERLTLLGRQFINEEEHAGVSLRSNDGLISTHLLGGKNTRQFTDVLILRPGFLPAFAVQHQVPRDADEPHASVPYLWQAVPMAQHAQECFLHHVLRLGRVARDGERYPVECAGILIDQRG